MEVNIPILILLCLNCVAGAQNTFGGGAIPDLSSLASAEFPSVNETRYGEKQEITLQVTFPPFTSVAVALELFIPTPDVTFAVWSITLDTTGLTLTTQPLVTRSVSSNLSEVYNSLYCDFGDISNDNLGVVTNTLVFGVALAKVDLEPEDDVARVGVGWNLNSGIIVGSFTKNFTINYESPLPSYTGTIACEPIALEIGYFSLCTASFSTDDQFSSEVSIIMDVENKDQLELNTYSIGAIKEKERTGVHLEVPDGFERADNYTLTADGFHSSAQLDLGVVVKPAGTGVLVVEVALSANNIASYAGQALTLTGKIFVESSHVGTATASVDVVGIQEPEVSLESAMVTIDTIGLDDNTSIVEISPGRLFQYEVSIDLREREGKYKVYLEEEASDPDIGVCSMVVTSRGLNTPLVLPPIVADGYILGHHIYNTRQFVDADDAVVKYLVTSEFPGNPGDSATLDVKLEGGATVRVPGTIQLGEVASTSTFESTNLEKSWDTLEGNRAVALRVKLGLKANSSYPNLRLRVVLDPRETIDQPVRICSAFMAEVDRNLPCLRMKAGSMESSTTYYRNNTGTSNLTGFSDGLELDMGSVNSLSSGEMTYEIHLNLPWGDPDADSPPYIAESVIRYQVSVQVEDISVWVSSTELNVANASLRGIYNMTFENITEPLLYLRANLTSTPVVADSSFLVTAEIKIGPAMSHDLDLLVYPPSGTKLCRLSLQESGRYLSCVQGGDWRHGERFVWMNTSRLFYETDENDDTYARLTMFGLTNVGNQPISVNYNTHNSLLVNIPLQVSAGFSGGTLTAKLVQCRDNDVVWAEASYAIGAAASSSVPVPSSSSLIYSVTPSGFTVDRMGVVEIEVGVPASTAHEMAVTVSESSGAICSSHVVFVGELMPCLNGSLATHAISSDGSELEVNLGRVCRLEQTLQDFPDVDKVRVRVAFLSKSSADLQFTTDLKYNGVGQGINLRTSIASASLPKDDGHAIPIFGEFDNNVTRVKDKATAIFNVTLPVGANIPVRLKLFAFPSVTRPSVTISNVQFVYAGRNLVCSAAFIEETLNAVPSDAYISSHGDSIELDTVEIDMGYLSNTGFTAMTYNDAPEDNVFTLSVDAVVNDALWNDNNAYVGVRLQVTSGSEDNITSTDATMQVLHLDTDLPVLNTSLVVEDPTKIHGKMDDVKIIFSLNHLEDSMAEPAEVRLVMYLPFGGYLTYKGIEFVGPEPEVSSSLDKTRLTTKIGPVRFTDTSEVTYRFAVNPENNNHFSYQPYDLTVPYEVTVKLPQRFNIDGYDLFPDNDTGRLPPVMDHIRVSIAEPDCADDLYLHNETLFPDCLFTASSVLDDRFLPHSARISSDTPWVPRHSLDKEWVEVDLVNLHKVSRLLHLAHSSYLQAQALTIMASVDRVHWGDRIEVILPQQSGVYEHHLSNQITGRYFRIYITSHYGGRGSIGFRFDLRGCILNSKLDPTDACDTLVIPPNAEPSLKGRHFAVDTVNDVLGFCEYSNALEESRCYTSNDAGVKWNAVPYYIGVLHGYYPTTQMIYAGNYDGNQSFSTLDGLTWSPVTQDVVTAAMASSSWVPSKSVAYRTGTSSEILGNWAANSQGVFRSGELVAAWGP